VRKRITSGKLVAEREGGRWFVLLPGEPPRELEEPQIGTDSQDAEPVPDTKGEQDAFEREPEEVRGGRDDKLIGLVREQQQTIMELAGQVGFLQGQLGAAQEEIKLLQAPGEEPVAKSPPGLERNDVIGVPQDAFKEMMAELAVLRSEVELYQEEHGRQFRNRRRWQFWRRKS
jgi:hypothetical protein